MDGFKDSFLLALNVLRPYLPDMVVSGGWVPFVYYSYLGTQRPSQAPLGTRDVDLTVPQRLTAGERPGLGEILQREQFSPAQSGMPLGKFGSKGPPETKYVASKDGVEIELTFMTPRIGKEERVAIAIPGGVVVTLMRYVDILLASNMRIHIVDETSKGQKIDLEARVPTPAAYCYQKALSFVDRADRHKKAKDLYYLFDLLSNYAELRQSCEKEIPKLQAGFPQKWYKRFIDNLDSHFKTPDAEGAMLVEEQRPGGGSAPAFRRKVCQTMQDFLENIR